VFTSWAWLTDVYETERGEKAKVAEAFFVACAEAVASKPVRDALAKYDLATASR